MCLFNFFPCCLHRFFFLFFFKFVFFREVGHGGVSFFFSLVVKLQQFLPPSVCSSEENGGCDREGM